MSISREELLLMTDLMRVCSQVDTFWLEFTDEALSIADEEAYALRLIDLGERLLAHARVRKGIDRNGEPTQLVVDAPFVRVDDVRALPPGSQPDESGS